MELLVYTILKWKLLKESPGVDWWVLWRTRVPWCTVRIGPRWSLILLKVIHPKNLARSHLNRSPLTTLLRMKLSFYLYSRTLCQFVWLNSWKCDWTTLIILHYFAWFHIEPKPPFTFFHVIGVSSTVCLSDLCSCRSAHFSSHSSWHNPLHAPSHYFTTLALIPSLFSEKEFDCLFSFQSIFETPFKLSVEFCTFDYLFTFIVCFFISLFSLILVLFLAYLCKIVVFFSLLIWILIF